MILKFITLDLENRTLEASWHEPVTDASGTVVSYQSAKCRNYSESQKAEFLADVPNGGKYVTAIGWI